MQTLELKRLEQKGNIALSKLRKEKHAKGLPFMINVNELPGKQCYLEYADGRIMLVSLKIPSDRNFTVVRELSAIEANDIRKKYQLA